MKVKTKLKHLYRDLNQWWLLAATLGLFLSLPLYAIAKNIFGGTGEMWDHIIAYFLLDYISNSACLIVGTGFLTSVIGVAAAWVVTAYDFHFRRLVEWLLFLPLAIPSYIVAYAYVGIFDNGGTLLLIGEAIGFSIPKLDVMNIYGLIWVLSFSLFPYVYAAVRAAFLLHNQAMTETAFLLGASRRQYFFSIALPLAQPALIAGLFLVFMEVLNDYGAAKYYGINTFTTGIFRTWTALEDLKSAIYLSAILIVLVFGISWLSKKIRGRKSFQVSWRNSNKDQRTKPQRVEKIILFFAVFLPLVFGLLLPISQLIYWAILTFKSILSTELFFLALQSLSLAIGAAFCTIISALLLIYFIKWSHLRSANFIGKIATIGYVIPGAVIGIGIISSNQAVINFFADTFDLKIGYLFYGSVFILVYAYVFRFLAVAYNPLEAATLKTGKHLSESAYLLGKNNIATLFKVELPLLKPALISSFLLVFIDAMKELPLTLILKPYDVHTLAVRAYEYADDERVPESAWSALLLILTVILVMSLMNKLTINPSKNENKIHP